MNRGLSLASTALAACLAAGCVESFEGSWVEFTLGPNTHVPGDTNLGNGKPPSGTHFEMWVVTAGRGFKMAEFSIVPELDPAFPCFIEEDDSKFPGLHTMQWVEKNLESVGGTPEGEGELGIIADANERERRIPLIFNQLKAVTSYDVTATPAVLTALSDEVAAMAPITDISDAASAKRRTICKKFFADHPNFYVGNDKVFALPLNGKFFGLVDGTDPRNAAPVGGSGFTVPVTAKEFDTLAINWQFNDPQDPRIQQFGPAPAGYHYMSGTPQYRTRRTINVPMRNQQFPEINGEVAMFPGIHEDDVQF